MSEEIVETEVQNPVVTMPETAKLPKKKKKAVKKAVVAEKTAGRPRKYDHNVILTHLKKNVGQAGGLQTAWRTLRKLKGYEKLSYPTVVMVARTNEISFKAGKPAVKVEPKKKKTKKKEVVAA